VALDVEDGTGRATAESYLSVADADTYHAAHGAPSAWSGSSTDQKEAALRSATEYLDQVYGEDFQGERKTLTQRLYFPRYDVYVDETSQPHDQLPRQLKEACAELALRARTETDGLIPDIAEPGAIASESVKVGPIEESKTYVGGRSQVKLFRKVDLIVAPLLKPDRAERA
jgi:hypothetical protein